jgi:quercetin dioxygenase-like cupin family protein
VDERRQTVGFVIEGRATLHLEGQQITLEEGDSRVVHAGAEHAYEVSERFKAVEATSPPARAHARDE